MSDTDNYMLYIGDIEKTNIKKLIRHCDKKIDLYFDALDKRIEKIVKDEVKRIMKCRQTK